MKIFKKLLKDKKKEKKQVITIFSLFITLFLSVSPSAFAALDPLPASRSPFGYGERYATDLFTGTASYSYPIKVPKGTNDLTPDVSLSYNSGDARSVVQRVGIGWQLSQDYVERDVNFTPGDTSDDKYKLHFTGGVYDLVYVSSESRYHTKIESNLNIQKLSGGQNDGGDYWQVITTDGTKYRFGYQSQSELLCNGRNYIASWNLDQVTDTHGNNIYYTYTENNGTAYLSQIKYNNDLQREIDFSYASTSYQRQIYQQGCNTTEASRLSSIQVKVGTNLIHQYDLSYTTAANSQSLLQSITEKGTDGSSLPATTFDYKSEIKNWANTSQVWINNADIDVNLQKPDVVMADVTGDGLLDIVKSEGNGNNTWKVWRNTGSGWNINTEIWVNNQPMDAKLDRTDTRLVDVTGDGLPDIVKANVNGSDGSRSTWKIWRNTGNSWNTTQEVWVNNDHIGTDLSRADTALIDINGDGLPDIVKTEQGVNNRSHWWVYQNTGSTWITSPVAWWYDVPVDARLDESNVRLIDVNNDGLPDIVKVTTNGTNNTWQVWKNTGSSWNTTAETWLNNAPVDANFGMTNVVVQDVNGDGLPDIVKSLESPNRWEVLLNNGNSWASQWEEWVNPSGPVLASLQGTTQIADVTGDGLPDIVRASATGQGARDTWEIFRNDGISPDLLSTVHTRQGGTISFNYLASTTLNSTGNDSIADLPFNLWVVQQMTKNNGLTNSQATNDVTTYNYVNGLYNWQNREFRGFGEVDETNPNSSKKQTLFNQDDALKGTVAQTQTTDSSGNPYSKTANIWSNGQSNGIYTVNLTSEQNYTYDGSASNPKITETDYQYDMYGNVTKKSELGDTSITGDEKYTYNTYTYSPSAWVVNTVSDSYVNDPDDATKVSETWDYYDNNSGLTDTPSKGDLTKEIKWLNGGTNPITQYTYDSYGNQTQTTDANNHSTQIAFGTNDTTHTYPDTTTNAKNQTTTTVYDLGTGNLLSKTDPNGFTTSYLYDPFGRVSKEIDPSDSSSFPTINYQYFDSSVPQGTLVSKLKVSSASATFDAYSFVDGLGRKIQTRTPAQDITKQIVTDTFYDPTGQVVKETVPHLDALATAYVTPLSGIEVTANTYDPLGRVVNIVNPQGTTQSTSFNHWVETNTDENGHQIKHYKDAYNNIIQVDELLGAVTQTTKYFYDVLNNLTKITDANDNNFIFTYDSLGRRISQTDPDVGTWHYSYDGVDNLVTKTDNRGITTTNAYDVLNRLINVTFPTDSAISYTYDGNNKIGTLTSVTDAAGTVTYTYDNRLRKTQEQRTMDAMNWNTQYTYDDMNNIISQTNPDGEIITYAVNTQNEIAGVSGILNNINYDALDHITQKTFANGLTTNYSYNTNDFRLNRIQTGTVQDQNYTYDNVGNVTSITDNLANKTQNFVYDSLDRLTGTQEANGYNYAYAYNPIGNLTAFTNAGNEIDYTYGQNAGVHALTSSTEPGPSITPTPTPSQNNSYTIYDEGLGSGWADWSWGSTNNTTDTTHPNTGSEDFSWTVSSAYGAAYMHTSSGVDTSSYTNLTFALRASQAGQQVQVQLYDSSDTAIGIPLQLTSYGGDAVAGSYKTYTIPLFALGGSNRIIHGIAIQDITGTAQPAMFIDTVKLTGSSASPTSTPTVTFTNTPTPTPTASSSIVYDDALASGWADWSWGATNNFSDTTHPYSGTKDISWINTAAYGALYFHNATGINTANYNTLTFALRASQAGQNVQVQLYDSSDTAIGTLVSVSGYGGNPIAGSYTVYSIPVSALGGSNMIIHGFIIQDTTGTTEPAMYVDAVSFTGTGASPTNTPTPTLTSTPTPTPTPPPGYSVYDEGVNSNWADWSWSSTNNFTDTTHPYSGSKDLSWTVTAAYAGLYLHDASGFSTSGYTSLTFALQATQSGQNAQVQLYDSSNNTIGSPLSLTSYGGNPVAGSYKVYTIPLSDLGGSSRTINGLLIQDTTGTTEPAMYIDTIGFH